MILIFQVYWDFFYSPASGPYWRMFHEHLITGCFMETTLYHYFPYNSNSFPALWGPTSSLPLLVTTTTTFSEWLLTPFSLFYPQNCPGNYWEYSSYLTIGKIGKQSMQPFSSCKETSEVPQDWGQGPLTAILPATTPCCWVYQVSKGMQREQAG
jgi:hypothetical protein